MKKVMDYIDTAFESLPDNKQVYKFKRKLIENVTDRANELSHAGLKDENVVEDLIISEHQDIKAEYEKIIQDSADRKKKKNSFMIKTVGSVLFFLAAVVVFLAISFTSKDWGRTWIFLVNGICLYFAYMCISLVLDLTAKRSIFHPFSRILLALSVYLFALPVFLILLVIFHVNHPWLVFLYAVLAFFIVDSIYAEIVTERFAIIFHLLYIVPAGVMIYIILSVHGVIPWHPGWLIIPAAFVLMIFVIFIRLIIHRRQKIDEMEEDSEWNEN